MEGTFQAQKNMAVETLVTVSGKYLNKKIYPL